jgi:predicted nucleotide-binding protein
MEFLNNLHVKIISIPKVAGQESLMERINHCVDAEFVVFVLSADFHVYSRNQKPVDANVAASQEAVFVLGYLAAKFDRQKIVVLYTEEPDFLCPTQFFDLFYVPVSSAGTWKNEVLRRMNSKLSIPTGLGLSLEKQPVNEIAG